MAKILLTSETRSLERRKPGFALLKISGWSYAADQTQMSIQRSEDEKYLGMDGEWEPIPVWQSLDNMQSDVTDVLEGDVGPALVDPIVNFPNNSYRVTLKGADHTETKTMRVDGDVLSSSASGNAPDSLAMGNGFILDDEEPTLEVVNEPEPEPVAQVEDSVLEPEPEEIEPITISDPDQAVGFFQANKLMIIVLLILLLLGLTAAAAWYFKWPPFDGKLSLAGSEEISSAQIDPEKKNPVEEIKTELTETVVETKPSKNLGEMESLQQFMASKPDTDKILAKAKEWQQQGYCNAMLRMMVHSGHKSDDSRIALEYGKMHDPNLIQANGCVKEADKDTAAYWYQKSIDEGNQEAKRFLDKL